ncbi:ADP-heptose--lipooligosaccharide heptosyltransferase II [hydrothermal vent metagenome]|uniref:ADP-heptose--lipooligosaccharide heptosyltransferase II n=1 Tax=hydrothermal vent metagenome TaxID=652676 RepID=A0A3B0YXT4_9ZZZZ
MKIPPRKLLLIRNDKLGDFMLALPCLNLLRAALPACEIHVLVPKYTESMALTFPAVDGVVIDPGDDASFSQQRELFNEIKQQGYDAMLTLYSKPRIGLIGWRAKIPYRIAPATGIAQFLYNYRLIQRRSRSEKPEYIYNLDVGLQLLRDFDIRSAALPTAPHLGFDANEITALRSTFCTEHNIDTSHRLIFIHVGSGGSANNLSIDQYAALAKRLRSDAGHTIVLSAGPGEEEGAAQIAAELNCDCDSDVPHTTYISRDGLPTFARHIAFANLFISGSTGPLHIAGALNCHTAAFYTRRRSATALRWQTCNSDERRLAFSVASDVEAEDMASIDIESAADEINRHFLTQGSAE